MGNAELQIESGHYTRIVNPLIERLIQIPFKGCELAVALFIIRKTYGYHKKQDSISLSQFQEGLKRSRQTIVTALKNLQLVKVARLVKKGNTKGACNIWEINKYYDTWELVNMARLVKRKHKGSLTGTLNLVYTGRHTKERKKEQKKLASQSDAGMIAKTISLFEEVNPSFGKWYANTTQRGAIDRLLVSHGYERLEKVISLLPRTNAKAYFPTITTPIQLETDWAKLKSKLEQEKDKTISKGRGFVTTTT